VLLKMNKVAEAQEILAEIKQYHPQSSETHEAEGRLALKKGDLDAAQRHFVEAHRLTPTSSTLRQLFNSQIDSGNVKSALTTIGVWILLHPDDMDSRHALAEKLISVSEFRSAQLVYAAILKRSPADPVLFNNLAYVTHRLGGDEAIEFARKAVEIAPDHAGFLDTYGWILVETGEPEQGLEFLRDAFTRQSTNQEIRYHIAVALVRLERENAARRELTAALASANSFPSKPEALLLLDQLRAAVE
jgi:Flp pilus assembly protein TadD